MTAIHWMQATMHGPFWDTFWYAASKIYSEDFVLVLIPILFWVTDRSYARYYTTLLVLQLWFVALLKGAFNVQRPPDDGTIRIKQVDTEGGFARPSGHASGSATLFTALALRLRRRWATALAIVVSFLVGVSRLYFGLHWPLDLILGWGFGAGAAYGLAKVWPMVGRSVNLIPFGLRLGLGAVLPALMMLAWENIPFIARVGLGQHYAALGALTGAWVGTLLEERYLQFDYRGTLSRQVIKCLVGLALLLAARYGFKAILPAGDWWNFLRYVGVGLVTTVVAPLVFARLPGRPAPKTRAT